MKIHLPGYESDFDTNDPIVPDGHFTWGEATHGGTRIPPFEHTQNVLNLASKLELVRKDLSRPMVVTSWYRPEPYNSRAGGARYSKHLNGSAVDFLVNGLSGREIKSRLNDFWDGGLGIYPHYPMLCHLDLGPYRRW